MKSARVNDQVRHEMKRKGGLVMANQEAANLLVNLQNAASELAALRGASYVKTYLQQRYGVSSPEELSSCDFDQAFDDLYYMTNDP